MLADDAKSTKIYQNEFSGFPLKEIFIGFSAFGGAGCVGVLGCACLRVELHFNDYRFN